MDMWEENQDRTLPGKMKKKKRQRQNWQYKVLDIMWDEIIKDVSRFIKEAFPIEW